MGGATPRVSIKVIYLFFIKCFREVRVGVELESNPGKSGLRWEYTLDWTHAQLRRNLESPACEKTLSSGSDPRSHCPAQTTCCRHWKTRLEGLKELYAILDTF